MLLGEEVRVGRVRAVQHGLAPHDQLVHARPPAGVEHVHRADAFQLVRPSRRVGRRREKGQVRQRVDALCREDLGETLLGGRLGQVDVVEPRPRPGGGGRLHVQADDAADARIFLEKTDKVLSDEGAGAGHGNHASFASAAHLARAAARERSARPAPGTLCSFGGSAFSPASHGRRESNDSPWQIERRLSRRAPGCPAGPQITVLSRPLRAGRSGRCRLWCDAVPLMIIHGPAAHGHTRG